MTGERKTRSQMVAAQMAAQEKTIAAAIARDAAGHVPDVLRERSPLARHQDAVELAVHLLRAAEHDLREEPIKVLLTLIGEADIGWKNRRRILAAFDHAGSRHGRRVRKLRRQFLKARCTTLD